MSLTSYRAAPPRVISAFGFSRMSVLPAQSVRIVASASALAECPAFCVSKIATLASVLRGQNRVFRLILAKQKGRLRAARLFRLSRSWKRRWFSRSCVEGLWLRADDLVFVLAFNRPGSDLLSRVLRRSTMGAGAFHGRVRNGNGCSHPAITTRSTKGKNCAGDSAKPNEKLVEV